MFLHNSSQGGEVGIISDHQWCSFEWWPWWAGLQGLVVLHIPVVCAVKT